MSNVQWKLLWMVKTKRTMEKFMPGWQFKNLTIESKVFYSSMIIILFWFMVIILSSCMSSIYKVRRDQIKVTHVLAVTEMGDTLKIPIESIKPNVIYNVVGYDYMRHTPYYSPYNNRYYYDYYPYSIRNTNYIGNNTGTGFGISSINPTTQISVPSSNSNSGTSGFSGNPVASNPVTSGGGAKKKN